MKKNTGTATKYTHKLGAKQTATNAVKAPQMRTISDKLAIRYRIDCGLQSFSVTKGIRLLVGEGWHGGVRGAGLGGFGKAKVGGVCWQ